MEQTYNLDQQFNFTAKIKKGIYIIGILGVILLGLGLLLPGGSDEEHGNTHPQQEQLLTDTEPQTSSSEHVEHHGSSPLAKRIGTNLWINSVFFAGLAITGFFFFAVQYVAMSGWSTLVVRIPMAFGSYLPIAFAFILVSFYFFHHDIFHWTHEGIAVAGSSNYDPIIAGKAGFLNVPFFTFRMIGFFVVWILFYFLITKLALKEDKQTGTGIFRKLVRVCVGFVIFFALSSSLAAWDWIMSIDTHWYSTMFGWYTFASWFVASIAGVTLVIVFLKSVGYLEFVNENHLHDLGKFVFGFSIFWAYIWLSQFLLIYYANIPEETAYFFERIESPFYFKVFLVVLLANFAFPFLGLMTRDAKRKIALLKIVCVVVVAGHWLDFYLMVTPGVLREAGNFGFIEIGLAMIFLAIFLFTVLRKLSKHKLVPQNHPLIQESLNHHI